MATKASESYPFSEPPIESAITQELFKDNEIEIPLLHLEWTHAAHLFIVFSPITVFQMDENRSRCAVANLIVG
jgi:hypothetical protein